MSILDEQKTPDQLRRDQWNQQHQEWVETAAQVAAAFPSHNGMIISTVYAPGRPPRRYYFQTLTVHL